MLKKPIKAWRVYKDGYGITRGPMLPNDLNDYPWVCKETKVSYTEMGVHFIGSTDHKAELTACVKTPKADKPNAKPDSKPAKAKKWRKAWVVMKGERVLSCALGDPPTRSVLGQTNHRARVRIEPEE